MHETDRQPIYGGMTNAFALVGAFFVFYYGAGFVFDLLAPKPPRVVFVPCGPYAPGKAPHDRTDDAPASPAPTPSDG